MTNQLWADESSEDERQVNWLREVSSNHPPSVIPQVSDYSVPKNEARIERRDCGRALTHDQRIDHFQTLGEACRNDCGREREYIIDVSSNDFLF